MNRKKGQSSYTFTFNDLLSLLSSYRWALGGKKSLLIFAIFKSISSNNIQWGVLQRTMLQRTNATTNSFFNNIIMLQRTVFFNKIRMLQQTQMLQRTNAITNSFFNIRMLQRTVFSIKSEFYNKQRYYNERMLQRTVFSIISECYNEQFFQ
jgi:hypothetical protein